jgi:aldehyde dehydrogenase (NAD+)
MRYAFLLIDLQIDFIERSPLYPEFTDILKPISKVLCRARKSAMPVAHIRTQITPSGTDRMPHWQASDYRACVAGTPGAKPPPELAERSSEPIFQKQFFSAFSNHALLDWLQVQNINGLWIAGLYTHGCVRATVMDAYERGFEVKVVEDGVASYDSLHGQISRDYLDGRAASFVSSASLLGEPDEEDIHYNPAKPDQEVSRVSRSSPAEIDLAIKAACDAGREWSHTPIASRRSVMRRFSEKLESDENKWTELIIRNLGKPRRDTLDELRRARGHLAAALDLDVDEPFGPDATISYQPVGTVAVITPWNNPVAIPVGKICSALLLGNSVVWKPAFQADSVSRGLLAALRDCGAPDNLVQLVNGGPEEVRILAGHDDISAVTLTGSEQAGNAVSAICRSTGKPLQAELGGNNAMLVLADADIEKMVPGWARMAFGFAGQRCTALRRFVVEKSIAELFVTRFHEEIRHLNLLNPSDENCDVGPLISERKRAQVQALVESAVKRGGLLLQDAETVQNVTGHYYPPTLLCGLNHDDPMVQEELFGPVALVQEAENFEHGLHLVNAVSQGLVAGIATRSTANAAYFTDHVEAGIVIDGHGMKIHPAAPFGGRKASQIGPPEHGVWDRQFFSRVQIRYRSSP